MLWLIEGNFWLGLGWGLEKGKFSISVFYHGEQLLSKNNFCPPLAWYLYSNSSWGLTFLLTWAKSNKTLALFSALIASQNHNLWLGTLLVLVKPIGALLMLRLNLEPKQTKQFEFGSGFGFGRINRTCRHNWTSVKFEPRTGASMPLEGSGVATRTDDGDVPLHIWCTILVKGFLGWD